MTAARCVALTICALGIAPALEAQPVPLGDPFHVRHGESVELAHGVRLKFVDVAEGRCSGNCVWQGEALVRIELQVKGQTARGSVTTQKPDRTLLAHRVRLLGLYPYPREGEKRPAKGYVAVFRVAQAAPASAKAYANRTAALEAAGRYVDAYTRTAKQVCADWQSRQLTSYVEDSSDLCWMIGTVLPTAHAVNEDADTWGFYFMVDNRADAHEGERALVLVRCDAEGAQGRIRSSARVRRPFASVRCNAAARGDDAWRLQHAAALN